VRQTNPGVQQEHDHLGQVAPGRHVQRRVAVGIDRAHGGAAPEQQPRRRQVPPERGCMQRRVAQAVLSARQPEEHKNNNTRSNLGIDVGSGRQQSLHGHGVVCARGDVQRRGPAGVARLHRIRTAVQHLRRASAPAPWEQPADARA
jgi:hypothetical protein